MVSWVSGGGVMVSEGARPEGSKEVTMDLFWVGARAADAWAGYSTGCRWPVAGPCVSAKEEPTPSAAEPRAATALLPLRRRGLEVVLRTARPAHRRGATLAHPAEDLDISGGHGDVHPGSRFGGGEVEEGVDQPGPGARWQLSRLDAEGGVDHLPGGPDAGFGEEATVVLDRDVLISAHDKLPRAGFFTAGWWRQATAGGQGTEFTPADARGWREMRPGSHRRLRLLTLPISESVPR